MTRIKKYLVSTILICGILGINSCKKDPVVPTLTTSNPTTITASSFVSGGNISSDGGAEVTARGICYGVNTNPDIAGSHLSVSKGTGSFTGKITGLSPNTLYHVRAYATNSAGTAYGPDVEVTTVPVTLATLTTAEITAITVSSAVTGGNITSDGNDSVTVRGVCWSLAANPTIAGSKTTDGAGKGNFVSNITGLQPGTTYHVRSYATNSVGTSYGNELTFTTSIQLAALTTATAASITISTAVSGGNVTADGGSPVTARGVCWATATNPTISGSKTSNGTGTGAFTSNLTGLTANTLYYVRAYATNAQGTSYGNEITFTTSQATLPALTTAAVTAITQTTAISGGVITGDGGSPVTVSGVCWSISANPTITDPKTTNGTLTGSFTGNITGLSPGVVYHVRAYATNVAGTAYGNDVSFTAAAASLPTVTTTALSQIGLTTAVSGGTIVSDGGGAITTSGICWSATPAPTTANAKTTDGAHSGSFTGNITGLTQGGTKYFVRAYATNSSGTSYGNELVFTTDASDIEGNTYNTLIIGTQIWMTENLKTTKLNDNTNIPQIQDDILWSTTVTPDYCWYMNNIANKALYGAMYNWFAIETGLLCPTGWHVPDDGEFNALEIYLGMPASQIDLWGDQGTDQGAQLKSATGWDGTNTSGFSGLPGGYRYAASGSFNNLGNLTYWWTSSYGDAVTTWYRRLDSGVNTVYRAATNKKGGKYVRCIKN